jgi:hypothetical protein
VENLGDAHAGVENILTAPAGVEKKSASEPVWKTVKTSQPAEFPL